MESFQSKLSPVSWHLLNPTLLGKEGKKLNRIQEQEMYAEMG